jgi:hypothetical protein
LRGASAGLELLLVEAPILYRTEALAVLEEMSDLVVDVRTIRTILEGYGEKEEEEEDLGE